MGTTSSSDKQQSEGKHFSEILKPPQQSAAVKKSGSNNVNSATGNTSAAINGGKKLEKYFVRIDPRAKIIKKLSFDALWENFLSSPHNSFALTASDISALLLDSLSSDSSVDASVSAGDKTDVDIAKAKAEIALYLELLNELTEKDPIKAVDFMSVCSSILLLSPVPIERKIDQLFAWITLDDRRDSFCFDDFFVALTSFERGLSHALGVRACSEAYVRLTATQWFTLADPQHRPIESPTVTSSTTGGAGATGVPSASGFAASGGNINTMGTTQQAQAAGLGSIVGGGGYTVSITSKSFFEFCTNRQTSVRKFLEQLGNSKVKTEEAALDHLQEAVNGSDDVLIKSPTGGDEFMANPAWIKTAEKMVPKGLKVDNSKPSANLKLDWVHGYRGFDCRNNVYYVTPFGSQVTYTTAALSIVQDNHAIPVGADVSEDNKTRAARTQCYFGEHSDDIISLAVFEPESAYSASPDTLSSASSWSSALIATGEIGKKPAVHLYKWTPKANGGTYTSLACMIGFHTKGVAQLVFSGDGKKLFTIGVEYTVAIYNTDTTGNTASLGKMIGSAQGPKGTVLHACFCGESKNDFMSGGEKHLCYWNTPQGSTTPTLNNCKLGAHKNKTFMSVCRGRGALSIAGTADGDLLLFLGVEFLAAGSLMATHNKAVNALWATPTGDIVVSGGRDGIVKLFSCSAASGTGATASASLTVLSLFSIGGTLLNAVLPITGPAPSPIRAVCLSADKKRVLVGTQNCDIKEFMYTCTLPDRSALEYGDFSQPNKASSSALALHSVDVATAHFKDELWGLAIRPPSSKGEPEDHYTTVGDDGCLKVFSVSQRRQIFSMDMTQDGGGMARCCAYSPDGVYLAVGFGGSVGRGKNKEDGLMRVYRHASNDEIKAGEPVLTKVVDLKEAKQWISEVKFSPDGTILACASRDNSIYYYSVPQQFKRKSKFQKHGAGINQLDFTTDGAAVQSCCSAYEILFSDPATGLQLVSGASSLAEKDWATWTSTLGWCTMGIWKGSMDGADINACARSPSGKLLAVADNFGKVTLYRHPCVDKKAEGTEYAGHSSHVTKVRWMKGASNSQGNVSDAFLISTGGGDKSVFQWVCSDAGSGSRGGAMPSSEQAQNDTHAISDSAGAAGKDVVDEFAAPTGGDEFMAVKPYLGAICAPTAWTTPDPSRMPPFLASLSEFCSLHNKLREPASDAAGGLKAVYAEVSRAAKTVMLKLSDSGVQNSTAPDIDELQLEWIHGYRGFDCRNNIRYLSPLPGSKGTKSNFKRGVVYHAAGLGVVLYPSPKPIQRFFRGHKDDITAFAVYLPTGGSGGTIVATSQQAVAPTFVWSAETLAVLATVETKQKTILLLEFSRDGRLLVSMAEDKSVCVTDWKSQRVLANTKGEASVTFHIATSLNSASFNFMSCGEKHIRYWTLDGRNLNGSKVSTSAYKNPKMPKELQKCEVQSFMCCVEAKGKFFVGAEDGCVYVVCDTKAIRAGFYHHAAKGPTLLTGDAAKAMKGGAGAILSIFFDSARDFLITGAKDGSVILWSTAKLSDTEDIPERLNYFTLTALSPELSPAGDSSHSVAVPDLTAKHIQSVSIYVGDNISTDSILLVVGTRGCDMLEISCPLALQSAPTLFASPTAGVLTRGHCNDELWGLATHPIFPEFCTVGDDRSLRFFSVPLHKMISSIPLSTMARCCVYHPEAPYIIAVGFGGRVGKGKNAGDGAIRLYSCATLGTHSPAENSPNLSNVVKLAEAADAKQWISDIKFSSDGRTLVAASHDCKIYIYDVAVAGVSGGTPSATLKLRSTFSKHNAVVNHIDLSVDGRFMQSNCSAYELLFCDVTTGSHVTKATELKDVKWDTWTCALGWPVQGIWAAGMDGSDINTVCRSSSGHIVATGDDFGKVNLFRYPCVADKSQCIAYSGHSSHVTKIKWTVADECLISVGGNDKCVFQWKHSVAEGGSGQYSDDSELALMLSDVTLEDTSPTHGTAGVKTEATAGGHGGLDDLLSGAPSGGDESGAVKPWLGAIKTPKNPPHINASAPSEKFDLKWVHGYTSGLSAANTRVSQNLFYNADRNIVYHTAALGVKMSRPLLDGVALASPRGIPISSQLVRQQATQAYFKGHDDDILCLAMSPDRRFVATGQTASKTSKGKGSVCIWDAKDCRLLSKLEGCHQRGVCSLAFGPTGNTLVSVGMDDKNTHSLWTDAGGGWSKVVATASEKSDQNPVFFSMWVHPSNPNTATEFHFVTGGNSINFWKLEGSSLSKKQGRFGKKYKQCPLTCAANFQSKDGWVVAMAAATGDIYTFAERDVTGSAEKAHSGAVLALAESGGECRFLVSGGKDKTVRVWNQSLQAVSSFEIGSQLAQMDGAVSSIDVRPEPSGSAAKRLSLLIGTQGGDIVELLSLDKDDPASGNNKRGDYSGAGPSDSGAAGMAHERRNLDISDSQAVALMHSHSKGELWGLAAHPLDADIFATAGDDGSLRLWSVKHNSVLSCVDLAWPARSVAWHPSGALIAVGFHEAVKGGGGGSKTAKGAKTVKEEASSGGGHTGAVHLYYVQIDSTVEDLPKVSLKKLSDGCDSRAWICDLKFSCDGRLLAAGSHDKRYYLYSIPDAIPAGIPNDDDPVMDPWKKCLGPSSLKFAFNKHSSAILSVDFSVDGRYIQSNCQAGELLFSEVQTGKQEPSATKMAEYNSLPDESPESEGRVWATQTCKLGWPVQGIWPTLGYELSDINAVDRNGSGTLLATADDSGLVKVFRHPCVLEKSGSVNLSGHSSHVTSVRWGVSGDNLLSAGGNDKSVFVWKVNRE